VARREEQGYLATLIFLKRKKGKRSAGVAFIPEKRRREETH